MKSVLINSGNYIPRKPQDNRHCGYKIIDPMEKGVTFPCALFTMKTAVL